jgi:hypothetical protein
VSHACRWKKTQSSNLCRKPWNRFYPSGLDVNYK